MRKLGFIGAGNMGGAMLEGVLASGLMGPDDIWVQTLGDRERAQIKEKFGVGLLDSNADLAQKSQMLVLTVKPNIYPEVMTEIAPYITRDQIVITVAPSYTIRTLQRLAGKKIKVARAMPNTPARVGKGMAGICFSSGLTDEEKDQVLAIFRSFGKAEIVSEAQMAGVTAISGSSPAFIFMAIEAMMQGGVKLGLGPDLALEFALQSMEGACRMVAETGLSPAQLRDGVCSPGGTTIDGVIALEQNGFKGKLIQGMEVTAEKFNKMQAQASQDVLNREKGE